MNKSILFVSMALVALCFACNEDENLSIDDDYDTSHECLVDSFIGCTGDYYYKSVYHYDEQGRTSEDESYSRKATTGQYVLKGKSKYIYEGSDDRSYTKTDYYITGDGSFQPEAYTIVKYDKKNRTQETIVNYCYNNGSIYKTSRQVLVWDQKGRTILQKQFDDEDGVSTLKSRYAYSYDKNGMLEYSVSFSYLGLDSVVYHHQYDKDGRIVGETIETYRSEGETEINEITYVHNAEGRPVETVNRTIRDGVEIERNSTLTRYEQDGLYLCDSTYCTNKTSTNKLSSKREYYFNALGQEIKRIVYEPGYSFDGSFSSWTPVSLEIHDYDEHGCMKTNEVYDYYYDEKKLVMGTWRYLRPRI